MSSGLRAAVEALADEWQSDINRGHAENPHGHPALSTHERDLLDLRAVLAADTATPADEETVAAVLKGRMYQTLSGRWVCRHIDSPDEIAAAVVAALRGGA